MKRRTHPRRIHLIAGILVVLCAVTLLLVTRLNAWHRQDAPWSDNVAVSDPLAVPQNPDVAVDIAGRAYVAWHDARSGAARGIYVASQPPGGTWTTPAKIPGSDVGLPSSPTIAVSAGGAVYVAWVRGFPETRADILFVWAADSGLAWHGPAQVNADSQDIAGQPDLAVDRQGNVHLVWSDLASFGDRHSRDVKWSMRPAGLTIWTEPEVVHPDVEVFTEQAAPAVTADDAGNVYAVWEDARHGPGDPHAIYAARLPAGTMMWEPGRRVDHRPGGINIRPDIGAAPGGTIHALWKAGTTGEVYSAVLRPGDQMWDGPTPVNDNPDTLHGQGGMQNGTRKVERQEWTAEGGVPRVAVDERGTVYAVWQDSRNGESDIYAAVRWPGGGLWGWNMRVSDEEVPAAQEAPAIAAGGPGHVVVVWNDFRHTASGAVYAAEFELVIHSVHLPFLAR